jgi:hypothetical protein
MVLMPLLQRGKRQRFAPRRSQAQARQQLPSSLDCVGCKNLSYCCISGKVFPDSTS